MKNLKTTFSILVFSGLMMTSCVDEEAKKAEAEAKKAEIELKEQKKRDSVEAIKVELANAEFKLNNNTIIDGKSYERSMNNDVNAMQISGWASFNQLSIAMKKLEGGDMMKVKAALPSVSKIIASLQATRPEWMMTEEITEDIEDLQKEYGEFMKEQNAKEKEVEENIEEINEAYDDLVEEINETFDKYVKINRKANEEYREEAKDGEMEDAREEYNEEIKKLDKVADDKK